jgi:hypothetical protein
VKVGVGLLEVLVGWGRQPARSGSPEQDYDMPLPAGARTVAVGAVGCVGRRVVVVVVVVVVVDTFVVMVEVGCMGIVEEAPRNHGLLDTAME